MSESEVVLTGHSSTNEGVQVSLHPLPLLNISEHYTRVRIQRGQDDVKVIGALIGVQQGREVEITNSFELALSDDGTEVNQQFFTDRQSQFKQVFPTFEFLGWYTVGATPTALDLSFHTQLLAHNESPIFLTLSPSAISSTVKGSTLPIAIYESMVDIVGGKSVNKFVKIAGGEDSGYKIETGEAERIAVESASRQAVASTSGSEGGQESSESTLVAGLSTQRNAIQMLHSRIGVILQYLSNVHKGVIPADHETLRQISALVSSISATSPDAKNVDAEGSFAAEFEQEQNDVLLTTILGQMTRNLESTNVLMDKFGITQQRGDDDIMMGPGGGRRGGGGGRGGFKGAAGNRRGTSDFGFF